MTQPDQARTTSLAWGLLLVLLVAVRLPSLAQPAGGDQFLYSYVGQRALAGDVPYRDAFEQKTPGIFVVYAAMWGLWPRESVVPAADLVAAALMALLLVKLGRRMFGGRVGESAAALFLLLGDPYIQRLSGLNVRAQCETFIALTVTAALLTAATARGRAARLFLAGVLCGVAFWLKYNAAIYVLPVVLVATIAGESVNGGASWRRALGWIAAGAGVVVGAGLSYFALAGALTDLWLGTVAYNVLYSAETYRSAAHAMQYVLSFPILHMRVDGLWFVGGLGALCLIGRIRQSRETVICFAWLAAAILSIAINGSRGLPQYFVQAAPALALAGAAGLAHVWRLRQTSSRARLRWLAVTGVMLVGAWRVGIEPVPSWQPRLFGLPQAAGNLMFDGRYRLGQIRREDYLRRFGRDEGGKFSPASVERLAQHVASRTTPEETVYVFGFSSAGVYIKSGRPSASRFFWSRPVVLEFQRGRPGYGSEGLLAELRRSRPAIVALQKRDWGLAEANVPNSLDFFMSSPILSSWLTAGYVTDYEDTAFVVWRRKD